MSETKPNRRWFRFSLRTLFVLVTLIGIMLGYWHLEGQRKLVRQREEFVKTLQAYDKTGWSAKAEQSPLLNPDKSLSPWRKFFGDHNYSVIVLPDKYGQGLVDEAVALFPEAQIQHWQVVSRSGPRAWLKPVVVQEMK